MRLATLERSDLEAEARETYDRIVGTRGLVKGPFMPLMYSPRLAGRIADVGTYIRFESPLPALTRSLAGLTVARYFDCEYEFAGVAGVARKNGLRDEVILATRDRTSLDVLRQDERLIVDIGQQLLERHRITDATFRQAVDLLGESGVVELVATFGYYMLIAKTMNAFEIATNPEEEVRLPPESLPEAS